MRFQLLGLCSRIIFPGIIFFSCTPKANFTRVEAKEYVLSDTSNNEIDSVLYRKILPYHDRIQLDMGMVIGENVRALEKGTPEGALGDFVADACLEVSKRIYYPGDNKPADFAFLNNGGLRNPLPKGPITIGDVYELMPFENELVILTLPGTVVKKIINFIASKDGAPVSGIRFEIQNKEAVNVSINNMPFDSLKTYKVVTSDYLANGGDQYSFLVGEGSRETLSMKVRDAIIQCLDRKNILHQKLEVQLDGRISHAR